MELDLSAESIREILLREAEALNNENNNSIQDQTVDGTEKLYRSRNKKSKKRESTLTPSSD